MVNITSRLSMGSRLHLTACYQNLREDECSMQTSLTREPLYAIPGLLYRLLIVCIVLSRQEDKKWLAGRRDGRPHSSRQSV